jgi:5'-AMP-activated protein kinase regulatory gamma subunit
MVGTHPMSSCASSSHFPGVVSAPLWNSEKSVFAGMFTVSDIIHLIQYYYHYTSSYDNAATDVETFRLESLRGV